MTTTVTTAVAASTNSTVTVTDAGFAKGYKVGYAEAKEGKPHMTFNEKGVSTFRSGYKAGYAAFLTFKRADEAKKARSMKEFAERALNTAALAEKKGDKLLAEEAFAHALAASRKVA